MRVKAPRAGESATRTGKLRSVRDLTVALALALVSLAIYWPTLSPSLVLDDGGELQMIAAKLGVAHPTGYPLYTLVGWIFTRLPLPGDSAFRVTLFSALASAITIALLFLLCRELGAGRIVAGVAAMMTAVAPRIWMHATAAEVYGLANLFIVLSLLVALRWEHGRARLWMVALALGVGLTHHVSLILIAPALLVYVIAVDPSLWRSPRRWLPALACLLAPVVLYAYIPISANRWLADPQWSGTILGVRRLIATGLVSPHYFDGGPIGVILALDYTEQFVGAQRHEWLWAATQFATMARQQFPLVVLPIALVGFAVLILRRAKASLLLTLSAGVELYSALRFLALVGEDGDHFIPMYLLIPIWFGLGAHVIVKWLGPRLTRWPWHRTVLALALALLPLLSLNAHWRGAMQLRQVDPVPAMLLSDLPEGAVVAGDWKWVAPLRYRQQVEGVRPDLWIIHADAGGTRLLMGRALDEQTPFYALRQVTAGLQLTPLPLQSPESIEHPADQPISPAVRWRGFGLAPETARAGGLVAIKLYWQVEGAVDRDWTTFIHLLDENGERVAQVDRLPLDRLYPPSLWQPGLLLEDPYELILPATLAPGDYRIVWGWYSGAERLVWPDGEDSHLLSTLTVAPQ